MVEGRTNYKAGLCGRRIGIYTGSGTSHSWLWFVDVLEKAGCNNLVFLDEGDLKKDPALNGMDAFLISGGDTFAIADGIGEKGAKNITWFIEGGGVYFGSCAGAYLPMQSSKYPLSLLNLVKVKISNLSKSLPSLFIPSEKFCTPYGCDYVFHPVRDEVELRFVNGYEEHGRKTITAPLYGGPCMELSEDIIPIAVYDSFTERTLLLIDEAMARETVLDRVAVCGKTIGRGKLYLSGPHLEHPHYPEANRLFMEMLFDGLKKLQPIFQDNGEGEVRCAVPQTSHKELKKELSGARIIALALERESMTWLVGNKVYEPEKFRVFIDALWTRLDILKNLSENGASNETVNGLITSVKGIREKLKRLKSEMHTLPDTTGLVEEIINELSDMASTFMNVYFNVKKNENRQEEKSNVHVL